MMGEVKQIKLFSVGLGNLVKHVYYFAIEKSKREKLIIFRQTFD